MKQLLLIAALCATALIVRAAYVELRPAPTAKDSYGYWSYVEGSGVEDISTNNIMCWYEFADSNEVSGGSFIDSSIVDNVATQATANKIPAWQSDGLKFDGTDDWFSEDSTAVNSYPLTISVWIKMYTVGLYIYFLSDSASAGDYIGLNTGGSSNFVFFVRSNGDGTCPYIWSQSYNTNTWYHVVAINSNITTRALYVNGVYDVAGGSYQTDSEAQKTLEWWTFGAWRRPGADAGGKYHTDSLIDSVRMYNRVLTPDEIEQLFDFEKGDHGY